MEIYTEEIICKNCQKKATVTVYNGVNQVWCNDCMTKEDEYNKLHAMALKENHMRGLDKLTMQERLARIESDIYDLNRLYFQDEFPTGHIYQVVDQSVDYPDTNLDF